MNTAQINKQIMSFLQRGKPSSPLSINERSLQVFGNEKFLASTDCKKILNQHGLSIELFNVYHTPEPFIYYLNHTNSKDVLIIENKDTWYTMRKVMMEQETICGMNFKALIYGEGRKIQSSFAYIETNDTESIHDVNTFHYFGDIDSSGIDILYKLKRKYPAFYIIPFEPGYDYLYKKKQSGRIKDLKMKIPISLDEVHLLDFLGEHAVNDIYTLCNHDYIIPQENMNYSVLKNWDILN